VRRKGGSAGEGGGHTLPFSILGRYDCFRARKASSERALRSARVGWYSVVGPVLVLEEVVVCGAAASSASESDRLRARSRRSGSVGSGSILLVFFPCFIQKGTSLVPGGFLRQEIRVLVFWA